nr:MAG TPA: hypothetical protein [Caudoviricetes sp.]
MKEKESKSVEPVQVFNYGENAPVRVRNNVWLYV